MVGNKVKWVAGRVNDIDGGEVKWVEVELGGEQDEVIGMEGEVYWVEGEAMGAECKVKWLEIKLNG